LDLSLFTTSTYFYPSLQVSRLQCVAIGEEYQRQFRMKLEKAINMKFKGE
jgi:hypothetical protein